MLKQTLSTIRQVIGRHPSAAATQPNKERRVWVRLACPAQATYGPALARTEDQLPAIVRNVSRGGLSLEVKRPFDPGMLLRVEIGGGQNERAVALLAYVVRIAKDGPESWTLACSFAQELSEADVESFGAARVPAPDLDPRVWQRFPCAVEARYQLARTPETPWQTGAVVNLSPAGIALAVTSLLEVGTLLSLCLAGAAGARPLAILATVVRCAHEREQRWMVGCTFIRELSDREMSDLFNATAA